MKEITYFYLEGCPYCKRADKLLSELISQEPRFSEIKINKIEERKNAALADSYDYYYVPCLFFGSVKLHEGAITAEKLKAALKAVLRSSEVKV